MRLGRRGEEDLGYAVYAIIAFIMIIIFVPVIYKIVASGKNEASSSSCKLSIIAAEKAGDSSLMECQRQTLVITAKDVFDGDTLNEDKLYSRIAKAFYDCKSTVSNRNPYGISSTDTYCLVCYDVSVDDSFREKLGDQKVHKPYLWLAENKVPNSELTYYQFMTDQSPSPAEIDALRQKQEEEFIDFSKNYVVIARTDLKGKTLFKTAFTSVASGAVGLFACGPACAVVGGVGGLFGYVSILSDYSYSTGFLIVPETDLSNTFYTFNGENTPMCTYLVN